MIFLVIMLALLAPFALWLTVIGSPFDYLAPSVPDGQLLYVLSKLGGLCAMALFTAQLALIVLRGTPVGPSPRRWTTGAHGVLGASVLVMVILHVALFVAAASARSGHAAFGLLLPRWNSGFYDAMVSTGALALYTLLAIAVGGALSRRSGRGARASGRRHFAHGARRVHRALVFASVPLVVTHSYAIGSETGTSPMIAFYAFVVVVALFGMTRFVRRARS